MFNTLKDCQLYSKVVAPFSIPTRNEDFSFSMSLLIVVIYYSYSHGFEVLFHCDFYLHFPNG